VNSPKIVAILCTPCRHATRTPILSTPSNPSHVSTFTNVPNLLYPSYDRARSHRHPLIPHPSVTIPPPPPGRSFAYFSAFISGRAKARRAALLHPDKEIAEKALRDSGFPSEKAEEAVWLEVEREKWVIEKARGTYDEKGRMKEGQVEEWEKEWMRDECTRVLQEKQELDARHRKDEQDEWRTSDWD
jgi:hypothetical protein